MAYCKRLDALPKDETLTLTSILAGKRANYQERSEHAVEQSREIGRASDDREGGA
jgi:hypothetical protein